MNKALAISLLVTGNLAAVLALSAINFLIILLIPSLVLLIYICLTAATVLGFASSRMLPIFERKYRLKTRWFFLASYVSPIIGAAVYWIVYLILDAAGYLNDEWFISLAMPLYALSFSLAAVAYLISGAIWSAIARSRLNANRSPK